MDIFSLLLSKLKDGMTFKLTKKDCAFADDFLIFNKYCRKQTITLHTRSVPYWIEFDGDEPMLLEDCPCTFWQTLLLNIEKGNYTLTERK